MVDEQSSPCAICDGDALGDHTFSHVATSFAIFFARRLLAVIRFGPAQIQMTSW
jgi:hypothetical protein